MKLKLFLFAVSLQVSFLSQGNDTTTWKNADREQHLYDFLFELGVKSNSYRDSTIIINYRNSCFIITRKKDSITISLLLYVRKFEKNKEILKAKEVVFYSTSKVSLEDTLRRFSILFDLSTAPAGSYIAKRNYTSPPGLVISTAYLQSFYDTSRRYVEVPYGLLDDVYIRRTYTLNKLLDWLLTYTRYWEKLEQFVRQLGYGRYKYGDGPITLTFEYKKGNKFYVDQAKGKVLIRNLPRI